MNETLPITERTRLRRLHERGDFNRDTINAILDAMPLCHVGYVIDGKPCVTPTFQWREGERVYWHGSSASRMLRTAAGAEACLTVTLLDGLVLARSGFHHSVNYRSVMVFGTAEKVADTDKEARMRTFLDGLYPGRWDSLRAMTDQELKATTVLSMPLTEASAKIRTGMPIDDEPDYDLPIWAGVIPVHVLVGTPDPDPRNLADVALPEHAESVSLG